MEIVYSSGGTKRFYEIAKRHGFLYGSQLPNTIYGSLYFADQDFKNPDRQRYMSALKQHKPYMATVIDWSKEISLDQVLSWSHEASQYVTELIIVPKIFGTIDKIPNHINGKQVRLGYSVPTRFGGSEIPIWEFGDRPVHLLGGSPHKQLELYRYLPGACSLDGNYFQLKAVKWCEYWNFGKWQSIGKHIKKDAPYRAFEKSCENIMKAWRAITR